MGRRTETISIEDEGRDKGKVFVITEMSAMAGERWAARITELVMASGVNVSADISQDTAGLAQLAAVGVPLLKAMHDPEIDKAIWECVRYQHDPRHPPQAIMAGDACQIEEIATITQLRMAVFSMHTGFFSPENPSTTASRSPAIPTGSLPTRTSRPRSAR